MKNDKKNLLKSHANTGATHLRNWKSNESSLKFYFAKSCESFDTNIIYITKKLKKLNCFHSLKISISDGILCCLRFARKLFSKRFRQKIKFYEDNSKAEKIKLLKEQKSIFLTSFFPLFNLSWKLFSEIKKVLCTSILLKILHIYIPISSMYLKNRIEF